MWRPHIVISNGCLNPTDLGAHVVINIWSRWNIWDYVWDWDYVIRSPKFFFPITYDRNELETWGWCQCSSRQGASTDIQQPRGQILTRAVRTAGGLSHFRTAGGKDRPLPLRTRKLRKITTSGKRRWIGRGKFYKKILDHFLIRSNLRPQGVKKGQIFSKSGYFRRKSQLLR